jgi:hypothetical protein
MATGEGIALNPNLADLRDACEASKFHGIGQAIVPKIQSLQRI